MSTGRGTHAGRWDGMRREFSKKALSNGQYQRSTAERTCRGSLSALTKTGRWKQSSSNLCYSIGTRAQWSEISSQRQEVSYSPTSMAKRAVVSLKELSEEQCLLHLEDSKRTYCRIRMRRYSMRYSPSCVWSSYPSKREARDGKWLPSQSSETRARQLRADDCSIFISYGSCTRQLMPWSMEPTIAVAIDYVICPASH